MRTRRQFLHLAGAAPLALGGPPPPSPDREWQHYGSDAGATRYSPLDQINRSNVKRLRVGWVHHTEDAVARPATTIECTPIVVDGVMYLTTCLLQVRAIDAATGKTLWNFDPSGGRRRGSPGVNRGLTWWQDPDNPKLRRIFAAIRDQLICLDAATGKPVPGFANEGVIDLKKDFDPDRPELPLKVTSPTVVYRDLVIVGGGGGDGLAPQANGNLRAFDARTGKRRWIFYTIPKPGEFGHDTWDGDSWKRAGGTNNWGGLSLDAKRGWLFVSTGSPSFDYYGGDRKGINLFGNCVIALDALTGKRIWHFQTVHHDVWDYDLPAQPALITVRRGGRVIDAVAQVTKTGFVFLFERQTGQPLFGVEERPVPKSDVPGEELSPTQPFPLKPPPLNRQAFTEDQVTDISPEARRAVLEVWKRSRAGGMFTPPSLTGTIVHPGFRGGALWGGCSFDPKLNRLFVNTDENTNRITLAATPGKPWPYELPERIRLYDHEGYPSIKPPWGYLTAIDLESGEFAWRVVNGEFPELKARGLGKTGTPTVGGSIATAGGLVFLAATFDGMFRAFDSSSGEILWEHQLEAPGFATPSTYEVKGKQYVVIAAGGGKGFGKTGDGFVAFALP